MYAATESAASGKITSNVHAELAESEPARVHRTLGKRLRAAARAIVFVVRIRKLSTKHRGTDEYEIERREKKGSQPLFAPKYFENDGVKYELSYFQRIFVTFEYQNSSIASQIIFWIIILAILLGVVLFILSGDPQYNITPDTCETPVCDNDSTLCPERMVCEPVPPQSFDTVDEVCVILFTIDYMIRLLTCWSVPVKLTGIELDDQKTPPKKYMQVFYYLTKSTNLIDLCAILPYYIGLGLAGGGGSSSFVRVLRLARLLRILKLGKSNRMVAILAAAMAQSIPALMLTIFFVGLGTITFASIFYIIEQGNFKVTSSYPDGAYMRLNLLGDNEEKSPFQSIPIAIYYTIITQTTVGYGDLYPTSQGGRALACILAYTGILVLALPISVVGSNFSNEYSKYVEQMRLEKEAEDAARAAAQQLKKAKSSKARSPSSRSDLSASLEPESKEQRDRDQDRSLSFATEELRQEEEIHDVADDRDGQGPKTFEDRLECVIQQCEDALDRHAEATSSSKKMGPSIASIKRKISSQKSARVALSEKLSMPKVAPARFVYDREPIKREYDLTFLGRIFMTFEDGYSSLMGQILSVAMLTVIVLSVICYIMSTIPDQFQTQPSTCPYPVCQNDADLCPDTTICEPQSLHVFDRIDEACVAIFTAEYMIRILLCWTVPPRLAGLLSETWDNDEEIAAIEDNRLPRDDPEPYTWYYQVFRYATTMNSMIDFVAIIPFYISLGLESGVSLSFVRVLRLARVLRLLKLMKGNEYIGLLSTTMSQSTPALSIMCFLVLLAIIFFGSVIYIAEQGTFKVSADYPDGLYMRRNIYGDASEQSPYHSIAVGIYWAAVTTTTLGYGDLFPTSVAGRAIACVAAYAGVLILALPIGVIGGNFMVEYDKMIKRREEQRAKLEAKLLAQELAALGNLEDNNNREYVDPYKLLQDVLDLYDSNEDDI